MSTSFEDRLLSELQTVVRNNPTPVAARHRRRKLSVAGVLATAGATVAAFALTGGGGTPAFAVDKQSDGSVTVTIHRLSDAHGLQAALVAVGVPAVVDYTPAGQTCAVGRFTAAAPAGPTTSGVRTTTDGISFTVPKVLTGQTLVVQTSGATTLTAVGVAVAQGTVQPCEAVPVGSVPVVPGEVGATTGPAPDGTSTGPSTSSGSKDGPSLTNVPSK